MEILSILLSGSGGAGEIFFIGALTGLASWGLVSLMTRKNDAKAKLEIQEVMRLQEVLKDEEGILKVLKELIEYFMGTYNLEIHEKINNEKGHCVMMLGQEYEAGAVITFGDSNIIFVQFINRKTLAGVNWTFNIMESQGKIIEKIDPDIKANLL